MENYSAIKRNNMREVKDARIKRLYPVGLYVYDSLEKANTTGTESRSVAAGGWEWGGVGHKGIIVVGLTQLHAFASTYRTGHQKSEFFCM